MTSSIKVLIRKHVSSDLALRNLANAFFKRLNLRPEDKIIIDFKGVDSISRSFAHEYLLQKKESKKEIVEINIPINVTKMFELVSENRSREKLIKSSLKPIVVG